jgi:hypothetical protein
MVLFGVVMLITPVIGKGPLNAAEKNPNAVIETGTFYTAPWTKVELVLPSGTVNRWIYWPESTTSVLVKPADKFYCPTEIEFDETNFMSWLTNPDYIGTWVHMSQEGYAALFAYFGMSIPSIPPEGVYLLAR